MQKKREANTAARAYCHGHISTDTYHTRTDTRFTPHQTHTSFQVKETIHPLSRIPDGSAQLHPAPRLQFGAASGHRGSAYDTRRPRRARSFTVSHHSRREKQRAFSLCLAAGTLKCITFSLGDLRSVFSPVVAD